MARADGMRVLTGAGVEAESELPFAGLHQLLWPILDLADELPDVQTAALRGAFGLSADRVEDRFLVSVAVLSLLTAAADAQPLLCVVDDAHWLDGASADALVFVTRRLQADPIAVLIGAREGDARRSRRPGCPSWCSPGCAAPRRRAPRQRPARGRARRARAASPAATRSPCSSCPAPSPTTSAPAARRCASTCR